jgi:hypothetical protein
VDPCRSLRCIFKHFVTHVARFLLFAVQMNGRNWSGFIDRKNISRRGSMILVRPTRVKKLHHCLWGTVVRTAHIYFDAPFWGVSDFDSLYSQFFSSWDHAYWISGLGDTHRTPISRPSPDETYSRTHRTDIRFPGEWAPIARNLQREKKNCE